MINLARLSQFQLLVLATKLFLAGAISQGELYPFGSPHLDSLLSRGDEAMTAISDLPDPFPFFGVLHRKIFVTNDGLLSLSTPPVTVRPQLDPVGCDIIAPFWADVDTTLKGQVWFRLSTDKSLLKMAEKQILSMGKGSCTLLYLLIATWHDVSYYRYHHDKTNTFQCVLTTDGSSSFAIFLYKQDGIQWTTGDASGGTLGMVTEIDGVAAIIGVSNNGSSVFAPSSGTQMVINISDTSNVNIPGVWIFQLDENKAAACTLKQESHTDPVPLGTLLSIVIMGSIMFFLMLGTSYGYLQVGRYINVQRKSKIQPITQPLLEKLTSNS